MPRRGRLGQAQKKSTLFYHPCGMPHSSPIRQGGLLQVPIRTEMVLSLYIIFLISLLLLRGFLLSLIQKKVTLRFDTTHRCRYVAAFDLNGNMLLDCLVEHDLSLTQRE